MKKTYINPEMTVVKIQPQQMLANSLEVVEEGTTPTPGTTLSRGFDFDDEDEEY